VIASNCPVISMSEDGNLDQIFFGKIEKKVLHPFFLKALFGVNDGFSSITRVWKAPVCSPQSEIVYPMHTWKEARVMTLQAKNVQGMQCMNSHISDQKIRVQLFSSYELHHAALRYICSAESGYTLECTACEFPQKLSLFEVSRPDLVIIESALLNQIAPDSPYEILSHICDISIVLLLADQMDLASVRKAIAHGVSGYLLTSVSLDEFHRALQTVVAGGLWLSQNNTSVQMPDNTSSLADRIIRSLSQRERQILNCVANGMTSKEVARKLCLSDSSVRTYWYRVLSKLNALNKAEALVRASRLGLLEVEGSMM
jgi:DNA-binding NarL/FixJ family response regulator